MADQSENEKAAPPPEQSAPADSARQALSVEADQSRQNGDADRLRSEKPADSAQDRKGELDQIKDQRSQVRDISGKLAESNVIGNLSITDDGKKGAEGKDKKELDPKEKKEADSKDKKDPDSTDKKGIESKDAKDKDEAPKDKSAAEAKVDLGSLKDDPNKSFKSDAFHLLGDLTKIDPKKPTGGLIEKVNNGNFLCCSRSKLLEK